MNTPNPVLDINGTALQQGIKYYVVPLDEDMAGPGFNLFSLGTENQCPKSVFQAEPYYCGCLIAFHPVMNNPDDDNKGVIIREWTYLNIQIFFDKYTPPCLEPNFWKIDGDPSMYDVTHYITIGGEIGNPCSWFKIVKNDNGYKFMYCPPGRSAPDCQDVGISEAYESRLVLSDIPFEFTFSRPETLVDELATNS